MPETFVIIDGNSLMHRAFHALPPLSNEDGVFTNAVFGFLSMLLKVVGDVHPEYLAVAFDLHGPTFRHRDLSLIHIYSMACALLCRPLCARALRKYQYAFRLPGGTLPSALSASA